MAVNLFNRFRKNSENPEMSFVDHLEALRWHLVRAVLAIMIVAVVVFINMNDVGNRQLTIGVAIPEFGLFVC